MATRQAGTLITTHKAVYSPPGLMPGYEGHCPTIKFDYGDTYGHSTAKYFQDYRSKTLNSSKTGPYGGTQQCGQFPSYYTHDPNTVIGNRDRTREAYLHTQKYKLFNTDHLRREEILDFDTSVQAHREYYNDKSATVHRNDEFVRPLPAEEDARKKIPLLPRNPSVGDPSTPIHWQDTLAPLIEKSTKVEF